MMHLSKQEARRILLNRQGLIRRDQFGRGQKAVNTAAAAIGWVQIDTISVVERAHHHVLHSRISNYKADDLHQLQKTDRHVFEYWFHALAYLPIEDYRFYLPVMNGSATKRQPDKKLAKEIRKRINDEGPCQSRDFEAPPGRKSSGWWDWKPAKVALERMFLAGELLVSHRDGFRKVYDLPERVLPSYVDTSVPDEEAWLSHTILSMVDACGLASAHDIGYRNGAIRQLTGRGIHKEIAAATRDLVEEGTLREADVDGLTYYIRAQSLDCLPIKLGRRRITFLSPFDNVVINRRRTQHLFDFDYLIECYVPQAKRTYGYFCLPILFGDQLIGRLDAKADRKNTSLIVKNLVIDDPEKDADAVPLLANALQQFALQNACDTFVIEKSTPQNLTKLRY